MIIIKNLKTIREAKNCTVSKYIENKNWAHQKINKVSKKFSAEKQLNNEKMKKALIKIMDTKAGKISLKKLWKYEKTLLKS